MSVIPLRIEQWQFNRERTLETLNSLSETEDSQTVLLWQPGPGRAHIGWQLMHLAMTEEFFAMMKPGFASSISEETFGHFRKGSTPDEKVPSLEEIRDVLGETRGHLLATVEQFTEADLGRIPDSLSERGWDVSTALRILAWHEPHHQGQAHITFNLWKASQGG